MKKHTLILTACYITQLLTTSCKNAQTETAETKQTYIIHYPSDTTNYTDQYNRKQGMWINFNTANPKPILYKNDTAYPYTDSTLQDIIKMLNSKP